MSRSIYKSRIFRVLLILFFIGAYLDIPLALSANVELPSISNLLITIILFPFFFRNYLANDRLLLISLALLLMATVFFSGNIHYLGSIQVKIIQFVAAIFIGITAFKVMCKNTPEEVGKIFFIITWIITIGVVLEYIGLLKPISDAFSKAIYKGKYGVYENADRDLLLTGHIRPKFFTSEPSLVSIGFLISSTISLLVAKKVKRFYHILICDIVFVFVSGSPIPVLNIVIWLILFLKNKKIKRTRKNIFLGASIILLFFFFFSGLGNKISSKIGDRLITQSTQKGESSYLRLFVGYSFTLPAALSYNPFVGVGFAGRNILVNITGNPGVDPSDRAAMEVIEGANSFSRFFVYFGLAGGFLMILIFRKYLKKYSIKDLLILFVIICLFAQTIGTFETPRFWVYVFLLFGGFYLRTEQNMIFKK